MSTVAAMLEQPGPRAHMVEFYDDDEHLAERVSHYLASGLRAGEPVLAIATEAHREAFARRLSTRGLDVEAAVAGGRLVMLDADATLAACMIDGEPSPTLFRDHVGGAIDRARGDTERRVRAYGEMVDVLWRRGEQQAALRLEGLWNELGNERSFALLCAYVMGNFYRSTDREPFEAVCRAHTDVLPAGRRAELADTAAEPRGPRALEQHARALEHEIAQRIQLEAALRDALASEQRAREEAERAVRFNDMFARMLGHDLRNPLGAITMGASYIARTSTNEKITRSAARILASTDRMSRMVEQLLDFSRIRSDGALPLRPIRLDLAELCTRVKEELEAAHPEHVIALELEGSAMGTWDYTRLLRAFSTVIGNAATHGTAGHVVTVRIDGRDPEAVAIAVHNAGAIAPDMLPVLFEPYRGTSRQHQTQGLGLGLFITQQIVRAHGGTIAAASTPAEGTTLRIGLPRTVQAPPAPETAAP